MVRRAKSTRPPEKKLRRKYTRFRPVILSRHPSHSVLRKLGVLPLFKFRSVVRFGSSTEVKDTIENGGKRIEINTIEAIKNSANKKRMKTCFKNSDVRTALWYTYRNADLYDEINETIIKMEDLPFPIIAKQIYGSRGNGNSKLNTLEDYKQYITGKNLNSIIFERFYNFAREYRLHVTEEGCFYTCRKMMKSDTPEDDKWFKNDKNCVWVMDTNPAFDRPQNWKEVEEESVKALKACGLDFGAIDLRIQSSKQNSNPAFIVIEINSAPSFGEVTTEKYKLMLSRLLFKKANA
jgi:glutathione synthase/RimK-type ligase-like ATP-grasp enzyme